MDKYIVGIVIKDITLKDKVIGEIHLEDEAYELYQECIQKGIDCVLAKVIKQHGEG